MNNTRQSIHTPDNEQRHYNLYVAFREMLLLDEAIGKFQKVVKGEGLSPLSLCFLRGCSLFASSFKDEEMSAVATKGYLHAFELPEIDPRGTLQLHHKMNTDRGEPEDATLAQLVKLTEVCRQDFDHREITGKIRRYRSSVRGSA